MLMINLSQAAKKLLLYSLLVTKVILYVCGFFIKTGIDFFSSYLCRLWFVISATCFLLAYF